jgi:hypothetical protein
VGVGIVQIVELIQHLALPLILHVQRQVTRPFHAHFPADQDQLGPVGAHRRLAFQTHVFRHQQRQSVAFQRRDHRQRNAGIAAGGLNQPVTGFYLTAQFRLLDHRQRGAVLHRARRIIAFQLDPNLAAQSCGQTL